MNLQLDRQEQDGDNAYQMATASPPDLARNRAGKESQEEHPWAMRSLLLGDKNAGSSSSRRSDKAPQRKTHTAEPAGRPTTPISTPL